MHCHIGILGEYFFGVGGWGSVKIPGLLQLSIPGTNDLTGSSKSSIAVLNLVVLNLAL